MNKTVLDRRLPLSIFSACRQCLQHYNSFTPRAFTTTTVRPADPPSSLAALGRQSQPARTNAPKQSQKPAAETSDDFDDFSGIESITNPEKDLKTHHFHIYATKHNTHITLTNPDRNSIISLSAGNIGFRKAARGTYDAAYQLAAYVLGRIYEEGLLQKIKRLEVQLRGFGIGREAVTKALLGTEGRLLRPKIVQVSDATRLKFGGTRSRKPRRLG